LKGSEDEDLCSDAISDNEASKRKTGGKIPKGRTSRTITV